MRNVEISSSETRDSAWHDGVFLTQVEKVRTGSGNFGPRNLLWGNHAGNVGPRVALLFILEAGPEFERPWELAAHSPDVDDGLVDPNVSRGARAGTALAAAART